MKRLFAIEAALAVVLLFLVAVQASRVIESHSGARLALARSARTGLKPDTLEYLKGLRGHFSMTYFVSARGSMPSSMKGIEDAVRALLERFREAAPERADIRVLDPGIDPDRGASYASGKGASPIKVRKVLEDESSEEAVWSSLALSHDQDPDVLLQGITPADLPRLEDWIIESLKAAANPITPVVAVSAPTRGYAAVRQLIEGRDTGRPGRRVVSVDLDREPRIPLEADVLLWVEPGRLTPEHALELKRFLATGRSAIVAGSAYSIDYLGRPDGKFAYRAVTSPCDWKMLLGPFGVDLTAVLPLDKNHEPVTWRAAAGATVPVDAPFQLRILPSLFDTKGLLGPNAGALVVSAVSPIRIDPGAVSASGRKAQVIATTSEHVRLLDLPAVEFDDASFEEARPAPKQPWMVLLRPNDAWQGDLLVTGSPVLFHDDPYAQRGNANRVFLETLLRTYTHPSRLARVRVPRPAPEPIPATTTASRLAWRGIAVLLVPGVLMVLALRPGGALRLRAPRIARIAPLLVSVLGLGGLLLGLRSCDRLGGPSADLTADRVHTPSPSTSRIIAGSRDGLTAELFASDALHVPARLKRLEPRIVSTLRRLGIRPRIVRPEDLPREEQAALRAAGIEPFDVERIEDDSEGTARIWCALRIERAGKTEVIPALDARAVDHLEFLLAAAVRRLAGDRSRLVGVLSDLPRLSPAEAHSDYQQKGYTAPVGSDVYSFSKKLLAQHGYRVAYINPESPVFPEGMDLLVWLQPRNPQKTYPQFGAYLASGGKAIVALQHYNVLQKQYRGTGFQTVYWPQPQFHGFNEYLQLLGVRQLGDKQGEQPGEVLLDRNHADLVLDTQVNRSAFREDDAQQVSRPFLIRAAGEGLSTSSVITSRLGDLLFIWPSRFAVESEKLARLGIAQTVLITTSARTWTYAWSGGWIPEESFNEPITPSLGRQPIAILLEGTFPGVASRKDKSGREMLAVADTAPPHARPGKLLLVGCSEMFKNARIFLPEYQHDQLLLNAVASLAYDDEMADLEARRTAPRTFPFQPPGVKLEWRLIAVVLPPLLFIAGGVIRRWVRRRPLLADGGRR